MPTRQSRNARLKAEMMERYVEIFDDPVYAAFVNHSGYCNFGYWEVGIETGEQACDNMVDRLLDLGPAEGRVLDVACGQGGTPRRLQRRFGRENVTAINIALDQIQAACTRTDHVRYARMDAARLGFAGETFDVVHCIEAAHQFHTRLDFLREARRILRPGGTLLLADAVVRGHAFRIPEENMVRSMKAFEQILCEEGYVDVRVVDVTRQTWKTFVRRYARFSLKHMGRWAFLRRNPLLLPFYAWRCLVTDYCLRNYVFVSARKP